MITILWYDYSHSNQIQLIDFKMSDYNLKKFDLNDSKAQNTTSDPKG